jgi:hypothetical protein
MLRSPTLALRVKNGEADSPVHGCGFDVERAAQSTTRSSWGHSPCLLGELPRRQRLGVTPQRRPLFLGSQDKRPRPAGTFPTRARQLPETRNQPVASDHRRHFGFGAWVWVRFSRLQRTDGLEVFQRSRMISFLFLFEVTISGALD